MVRRLPSLPAVKAFEAAARHTSFKAAARELHVTPAAVSHQIKVLEEELGLRLFRRRPRQVTLTEPGRELFEVATAAFDSIAATVGRLTRESGRSTVTLGVGPIFASRWLSPRLLRFWESCPEIDLRLHHSVSRQAWGPAEFRRSDMDLAIVWGDGDWSGVAVEPLVRIAVTPVCAPALLADRPALRAPGDLAGFPLLHQGDREGWADWLTAAGAEGVDPRAGVVIEDAHVALQAALAGQGVALGILPFVADDLASGRLVRPFARTLAPAWAYHLVYPKGALARPALGRVRDWLIAEAGA